MSVVVDATEPLEQLAATAAAWGVSINVLVEINAGQDRWAGIWVGWGWAVEKACSIQKVCLVQVLENMLPVSAISVLFGVHVCLSCTGVVWTRQSKQRG